MNVNLGDFVENIVDQLIGDHGFVFHRQIIFLKEGRKRSSPLSSRSVLLTDRDEILQSFDIGVLRVVHLHGNGLSLRLEHTSLLSLELVRSLPHFVFIVATVQHCSGGLSRRSAGQTGAAG